MALDDAQRVIAAGMEKAREIGQPQNIAVVEAGGNLVAQVRMDGAWLGSVDVSINKAFTTRAFDVPTKSLAENAQPGQRFYGIDSSNTGRVMIFAGGIPLQNGGRVGVSGGTGEQDQRSPKPPRFNPRTFRPRVVLSKGERSWPITRLPRGC